LGVWGDPQVGRPEQYLDDQKNTTRWRIICHSGVKESGYPYLLNLVIRFSVTITTTKVWNSNYSEYQE